MTRENNAVQVHNAAWNGLQTVGEDDWRFLLEMFLNSQDISEKSRQTYSWALMRYFEWLRLTGRARCEFLMLVIDATPSPLFLKSGQSNSAISLNRIQHPYVPSE